MEPEPEEPELEEPEPEPEDPEPEEPWQTLANAFLLRVDLYIIVQSHTLLVLRVPQVNSGSTSCQPQ